MSLNQKKDVVQPINTKKGNWPPSWQTLDHGIRVGRYTDPRFLELEFEKLWSKVWQIATRIDAIPEVNDFYTYNIGERSVFIVRTDEETVKAFHNVCPHRGTALAEGLGSFEHGNVICPFHGWRWDTDGNNQFILLQDEFRDGKLCNSDVGLKEINCKVYGGFIFVNFDPDCVPFDEYIEPIRHFIDDLNLEEMRHYWWKSIPIPSNWKVAQEAFFEGYHVPATHPQLETSAADFIYGEEMTEEFSGYNHENIGYETFANGHGRFFAGKPSNFQGNTKRFEGSGKDPVDTMADRLQLLVDGMDAQVLQDDVDLLRSLKGKPIPEGSSLGGEYVRILYEDAAAKDRPMPKLTPEILNMWGGELFIFPNLMVLPQAGNAMIYRVTPDAQDPNKCTFDIFSTRTLPAAAERERAIPQHVSDPDDPDQVYLIPRQDLGNLKRMQNGLRTGAINQIWLANYQEQIIMGMHRELDKFLMDDSDE